MKETIDVGLTVSVSVGVPEVASGSASMSANIGLESTQSDTKTESQTWEIDRTVRVPPRTKVDMMWTVNQQSSAATFYASVILTGNINVMFKDPVDLNNGGDNYRQWLVPIDYVFKSLQDNNCPTPNYSIGSGYVTYAASGECQGESGYNTTFTLKQTPLQTNKGLAEPRLITEIATPARKKN